MGFCRVGRFRLLLSSQSDFSLNAKDADPSALSTPVYPRARVHPTSTAQRAPTPLYRPCTADYASATPRLTCSCCSLARAWSHPIMLGPRSHPHLVIPGHARSYSVILVMPGHTRSCMVIPGHTVLWVFAVAVCRHNRRTQKLPDSRQCSMLLLPTTRHGSKGTRPHHEGASRAL